MVFFCTGGEKKELPLPATLAELDVDHFEEKGRLK